MTSVFIREASKECLQGLKTHTQQQRSHCPTPYPWLCKGDGAHPERRNFRAYVDSILTLGTRLSNPSLVPDLHC